MAAQIVHMTGDSINTWVAEAGESVASDNIVRVVRLTTPIQRQMPLLLEKKQRIPGNVSMHWMYQPKALPHPSITFLQDDLLCRSTAQLDDTDINAISKFLEDNFLFTPTESFPSDTMYFVVSEGSFRKRENWHGHLFISKSILCNILKKGGHFRASGTPLVTLSIATAGCYAGSVALCENTDEVTQISHACSVEVERLDHSDCVLLRRQLDGFVLDYPGHGRQSNDLIWWWAHKGSNQRWKTTEVGEDERTHIFQLENEEVYVAITAVEDNDARLQLTWTNSIVTASRFKIDDTGMVHVVVTGSIQRLLVKQQLRADEFDLLPPQPSVNPFFRGNMTPEGKQTAEGDLQAMHSILNGKRMTFKKSANQTRNDLVQCLDNIESICRFVIAVGLRLHPTLPIFGVFIPMGCAMHDNFCRVTTISRDFFQIVYDATTYFRSPEGALGMDYLRNEVPPATLVVNLGAPDRFKFPGLQVPNSWTEGDSVFGGYIYLHNVLYVRVLEWLFANKQTEGMMLGAISHEEWIVAYEEAGQWFTPP